MQNGLISVTDPVHPYRAPLPILHNREAGLLENFQIKEGQAYELGVTCPHDWNSLNSSAKQRWGLEMILYCPHNICSVGPAK